MFEQYTIIPPGTDYRAIDSRLFDRLIRVLFLKLPVIKHYARNTLAFHRKCNDCHFYIIPRCNNDTQHNHLFLLVDRNYRLPSNDSRLKLTLSHFFLHVVLGSTYVLYYLRKKKKKKRKNNPINSESRFPDFCLAGLLPDTDTRRRKSLARPAAGESDKLNVERRRVENLFRVTGEKRKARRTETDRSC